MKFKKTVTLDRPRRTGRTTGALLRAIGQAMLEGEAVYIDLDVSTYNATRYYKDEFNRLVKKLELKGLSCSIVSFEIRDSKAGLHIEYEVPKEAIYNGDDGNLYRKV